MMKVWLEKQQIYFYLIQQFYFFINLSTLAALPQPNSRQQQGKNNNNNNYPTITVMPRLVEMTDAFEEDFLREALSGRIPGMDGRSILDMALWFNGKAFPCCERLLDATGTRGRFNCQQLPQPTDQQSAIFLNRMIFECIGEGKNVRECCTRKGVKSQKCLTLCDASSSAHQMDAVQMAQHQQLIENCAVEMNLPKERFLWNLFECINPGFSRVMQVTQELKAEEQKQKNVQRK